MINYANHGAIAVDVLQRYMYKWTETERPSCSGPVALHLPFKPCLYKLSPFYQSPPVTFECLVLATSSSNLRTSIASYTQQREIEREIENIEQSPPIGETRSAQWSTNRP